MLIPSPPPFFSHLWLLPVLPTHCATPCMHPIPHDKLWPESLQTAAPHYHIGLRVPIGTLASMYPSSGNQDREFMGHRYPKPGPERTNEGNGWLCPLGFVDLYPRWKAQSGGGQCTALKSQARAGTSGALCLQGFATELTHLP